MPGADTSNSCNPTEDADTNTDTSVKLNRAMTNNKFLIITPTSNSTSNDDNKSKCENVKQYITHNNLNEYINNINVNTSDTSEILKALYTECKDVELLTKVSSSNNPIQCTSKDSRISYMNNENECKQKGIDEGSAEISWNDDTKICLLSDDNKTSCELEKINLDNPDKICETRGSCNSWSINYKSPDDFNHNKITMALNDNLDITKWKSNTNQLNLSNKICKSSIPNDPNDPNIYVENLRESFYNIEENKSLNECKSNALEKKSYNYSWIPNENNFNTKEELESNNTLGTCTYFDKDNNTIIKEKDGDKYRQIDLTDTEFLCNNKQFDNTFCPKHICKLVDDVSTKCKNQSTIGTDSGLKNICYFGTYNSKLYNYSDLVEPIDIIKYNPNDDPSPSPNVQSNYNVSRVYVKDINDSDSCNNYFGNEGWIKCGEDNAEDNAEAIYKIDGYKCCQRSFCNQVPNTAYDVDCDKNSNIQNSDPQLKCTLISGKCKAKLQ